MLLTDHRASYLAGSKPFVAAAPAAAATRRPRCSLEVRAQQEEQSSALDRRTLLAGMGAALVAAQQQGQPAAAAEECAFQTATNGLQWCDVVEGSGDAPVQGAMIRAHYTGRLASNGAVFDSSYPRGRPLQFKIGVGQVIKGWDRGILGGEGVPAMREGGKRRLIIPAELGYGARGAGGVIPPNATLEFDVELLGKRRMG
ncbi:hypothetical protein ABPG75_009096 [Micractinium tetrahymenae]